jgi:hypothetical protein
LEQSELQNTFTVPHEKQTVTLESWRVALFETEEGAQTYARSVQPYQDRYAQALRTALPIREKPDRTSTRIYRLRDGEITKVLVRQDQHSDEAGLVDYWYQVLTQDGTIGWVFGYYLDLVDSAGRSLSPQGDADKAERMVQEVAGPVWRPDYYRNMIDARRIDLQRVRPNYGFSLDLDEHVAHIVLPTHRRDIQYTDYFSPAGDTIEFRPSGLTIFLFGSDEIRIQYELAGQQRTATFVTIEEDIDAVIAGERERRRQILQSFLSRGNVLVSTAYGRITLTDDGAFSWENYTRLVPQVLSSDFNGRGTVQFSLFLQPDLRTKYDGALRLAPNDPTLASPAFLYRLSDEGVRMVLVPDDLVTNDLVTREPLSPVVLFYRFVSS